MRRLVSFPVLTGVVILTGCATVLNYVYLSDETYPPKSGQEPIEFISLAAGAGSLDDANLSEPYEVLARFDLKQEMGEGNLAEKAIEEARKIGGDAVVYQPTGAAGTEGQTNATATVWVIRYERE